MFGFGGTMYRRIAALGYSQVDELVKTALVLEGAYYGFWH
jgi:hypothetical protein